ncbi:hypothetical protein BDU57DRAFT_521861 [Ampelomyces quisqualis]|uniref:Uncharacterized protein n=1 Tax=Ampelomyces quisqualis TaxID=50730 RepID=A0A6A5QCQ1_AMPQU|nr:hypothetical protein BDU57DRAFT_521861 [Ampelomyces quisqualis]
MHDIKVAPDLFIFSRACRSWRLCICGCGLVMVAQRRWLERKSPCLAPAFAECAFVKASRGVDLWRASAVAFS